MKSIRNAKHYILFLAAIIVIAASSNSAFASDMNSICESDCIHDHEIYYVQEEETVWEKEVTVEVTSEEEFLQYPKNPNYKYTFVITPLRQSRAVCYMCGRSTLGTSSYKEQSSAIPRLCPLQQWGNDIFMSWENYTYERCTGCGYRSQAWHSQTTYTAQCLNGNSPWYGGDWVVHYDYTQSTGYNLHQSLRWWTEYSYI